MIYFNWPPGPFLATQYDKEPGGAGFEANRFYYCTIAITAYHKRLAAMLLNQKAWLVSPSISIPMGCHGAGNDYHLPSVSEWWTWKTLNAQLFIIFSLHIMSNSTHKQSSSLIIMAKTGLSGKWPYENFKWTDHVHSPIQKLHFSSTTEFF